MRWSSTRPGREPREGSPDLNREEPREEGSGRKPGVYQEEGMMKGMREEREQETSWRDLLVEVMGREQGALSCG